MEIVAMCTPKTCIYCKQTDPARFMGVEHVIPQAFGTFGSDTPTLDCVCDDCNDHFGRNHDLYLARETVEGVIRYKKGILSSARRPQKHLHITLDEGAETGGFAGMKVAIDGTTGELMEPKAQFQIVNQKTGVTETYFKHQLAGLHLLEDIYGKPGSDRVKGSWICRIFAPSKEEHEEVIAILRSNGITFLSGEPFLIPEPTSPDRDGKFTVPLSLEGEIGLEHRQAHAKILLNLIAKYLGCDEAAKPSWDFLRRYARYGEGTIKYRVGERLLASDKEIELQRLIGESIVIQIRNTREHVTGSIRFYGNHTYEYILRENEHIPNDHVFGFMFTDGKQPVWLPQRVGQ